MVQSCCSQPRCLGQAARARARWASRPAHRRPDGRCRQRARSRGLWRIAPRARSPSTRPAARRLQERLDAHREASGAPGATLAVVLPGGEDLAIASGLAERDDRFPMSVDHRMLAGAVGKTLAAAIVVLLADEGVVGLDAPLSDLLGHLPWFSGLPNAGTLTLRRLLNHTSGLPDHMTSPEFIRAVREDPARAWSPEQVVAHVIGRTRCSSPGRMVVRRHKLRHRGPRGRAGDGPVVRRSALGHAHRAARSDRHKPLEQARPRTSRAGLQRRTMRSDS